MKAIKISMMAMALTFTLGMVSCADRDDDDKIIQVEKTERIIERDKDKVDVGVKADDGKLDISVDNDKSKVDVELGKDDK